MIARALCGFILVPIFGYVAVCLASPIAWICADLFLIPGYISVLNKMKRKIKPLTKEKVGNIKEISTSIEV